MNMLDVILLFVLGIFNLPTTLQLDESWILEKRDGHEEILSHLALDDAHLTALEKLITL